MPCRKENGGDGLRGGTGFQPLCLGSWMQPKKHGLATSVCLLEVLLKMPFINLELL